MGAGHQKDEVKIRIVKIRIFRHSSHPTLQEGEKGGTEVNQWLALYHEASIKIPLASKLRNISLCQKGDTPQLHGDRSFYGWDPLKPYAM